MLIFQPPVNFCSDENIQTIFLIKLEDFLNYRIDYNSLSQTIEKVVKKIFLRRCSLLTYDPKWVRDSTGLSGGFRVKGSGFRNGRQATFRGWCLSCPVVGTSAQFLICRKINQKSLRLNKLVYSPFKTVDKFQSGSASCELVRTITKMVPW
jgi:hypothetical protein